jgi:hypothetical protein
MNESTPPRFIIGIDLGTTNCAVAFVDTRNAGRAVADFPVRQFTAPGITEARDTLPSFLYALIDEEITDADRAVHPVYRVGTHAREHGALTPGRHITSAKSWLCHGGIDRRSPVLPWHASKDVKTISPVDAQSIILNHLRTAWDVAHPDHPMAGQQVYITVPASFDEVARELTIEAAKKAGIPAPVLLEEPQAAFYAWLSHHETTWAELIAADDHILVCDVGGGTTDLTLIHARPDPGGPVVFHRTAVGDHLILGGDNLDLALAHVVEEQMSPGNKLDARSWSTLVRRCRHYKESLLSDQAPDQLEVVLPGTGSGLLRNQRQTTITRQQVEALLLDGFMPMVPRDAVPAKKSSGFQEFDLPYAPDPAITRYLAEFLRTNLPRDENGESIPPRAVLLNGGLFESPVMRRRFYETLIAWFGDRNHGAWKPLALDHRRLDLAVARGAAYFGLVRRGHGVRVVSNLARAYYIGFDSREHPGRVLCVAPADLASGQTVRIDQHPLTVKLKTPVEFPLFVSSRRTTDQAGDMVTLETESFTPMPPMRTVLTAGKAATQTSVRVSLSAHLSELGTLDLSIAELAGDRAWKLGFDLRAATQTDLTFHDGKGERSGMIDQSRIDQTIGALKRHFLLTQAQLGSTSIYKELESIIEQPRTEWPVSLLRALWAALMDLAPHRATSAVHEQRWLNLTGYCLRPGFGYALDDWRITEMWKRFPRGLSYAANDSVRAEWWMLWRRMAGGLTQGQQTALALPLMPALKALIAGKPKARVADGWEIRLGSHETIELFRLIGMLERLPVEHRKQLGEWMLERSLEQGSDRGAALWALGRIGSRAPLYGSIQQIIPPDTVSAWLTRWCNSPAKDKELAFALMSMARRTRDRYRDMDDETRGMVVSRITALNAPEHWITLVKQGGALDAGEQDQAFGEQLPRGLSLAE